MPGAPSFAVPGLRPLAGPGGDKVKAAISKIQGSSDASWIGEVRDYLGTDEGKAYIVGKYGADAYDQLTSATTDAAASLDMRGKPQGMPAPADGHPFETLLGYLNRPEEAALGALDQFAKLPAGQKLAFVPYLQQLSTASTQQTQANAAKIGHAALQGIEGKASPVGGQVIRDLGIKNGLAQAVGGTALEFATNPLTYVPLGDILAPLKAVAKPLADAMTEQGFIDTSRLAPKAAAAVEKAFGKASEIGYKAARAFNRFAFFPKAAKQIWQARDATTTARIAELQNAVKRAFGEYATQTGKAVDDDLLTAVTHHVEDKYYRP